MIAEADRDELREMAREAAALAIEERMTATELGGDSERDDAEFDRKVSEVVKRALEAERGGAGEDELAERIATAVREELFRQRLEDDPSDGMAEKAADAVFARLSIVGDKDINNTEGSITVERLAEGSYLVRFNKDDQQGDESASRVYPWTYEDGQWRNPCLQVGNTIYHDPSSFSGLGGVEGDNYVNFNLSSNSISVGPGAGSNNVLSFYIGTLSGSAQVAGIYSMPVAFVYT